MPAKYDEAILQKYIDSLYSRARWIIFWCALRGLVIGAIIGAVGGYGPIIVVGLLAHGSPIAPSNILVVIVVVAIVGLITGVSRGENKAFQLKLLAQRVLCQMQIERNTHTSSEARSLGVTDGLRSG